MTQVFISYSRSDMEFVQRLAVDLQDAGLDVWWDLSGIQGSDVWERKIEEGLNASNYFIVVLSPASLDSRWVRREYLSADNKGLKIIPLKLKTYKDIPLTLRDIQPIDAVDRNYADVLSEVLRVLGINGQTGSVEEGEIQNQTTNLAVKTPDSLTVSNLSTPMGVLDLSASILFIVFFILVGLEILDLLNGDVNYIVMGLAAILSAFYLFFKRQVGSGLPLKYSMVVFLLTHVLVSYSNVTGIDMTIIPGKLEGLVALLIAGLLIANLRSPRKPAPYSSILLGIFLLLVGGKTLLNQFGSYPSEIYSFIILSAIISSILLWLDQ